MKFSKLALTAFFLIPNLYAIDCTRRLSVLGPYGPQAGIGAQVSIQAGIHHYAYDFGCNFVPAINETKQLLQLEVVSLPQGLSLDDQSKSVGNIKMNEAFELSSQDTTRRLDLRLKHNNVSGVYPVKLRLRDMDGDQFDHSQLLDARVVVDVDRPDDVSNIRIDAENLGSSGSAAGTLQITKVSWDKSADNGNADHRLVDLYNVKIFRLLSDGSEKKVFDDTVVSSASGKRFEYYFYFLEESSNRIEIHALDHAMNLSANPGILMYQQPGKSGGPSTPTKGKGRNK
jgi:hypothetical protein